MTNAGASGPAALREQRADGDHGADGDEEGGAAADGADSGGEEREEMLCLAPGGDGHKKRSRSVSEIRNVLRRINNLRGFYICELSVSC